VLAALLVYGYVVRRRLGLSPFEVPFAAPAAVAL